MVILYTTMPSQADALILAREAVASKFAACVNIIPGVTSIYSWKDQVEKSEEVILLFKTTKAVAIDLETWLINRHPYELPAIIKFSAES